MWTQQKPQKRLNRASVTFGCIDTNIARAYWFSRLKLGVWMEPRCRHWNTETGSNFNVLHTVLGLSWLQWLETQGGWRTQMTKDRTPLCWLACDKVSEDRNLSQGAQRHQFARSGWKNGPFQAHRRWRLAQNRGEQAHNILWEQIFAISCANWEDFLSIFNFLLLDGQFNLNLCLYFLYTYDYLTKHYMSYCGEHSFCYG